MPVPAPRSSTCDPGSSPKVVTKKSIADGQLDATVAEFPVQEGQLGVEMAIRQLEGQKLPAWIVSQQDVITKENVSKFQ